MHIHPPTPPQDDLVHSLIQPVADLSLGPSGSCTSAELAWPLSYDPTSPSYDLGIASPCNPFPSSSPFYASFPCPAMTRSRLTFEDACAGENSMPAPQQPQQPHPQPQPHAATALSHIPPPHSAPALRRTKPCRFFLSPAGCKTGRWCNFKHPVRAPDDDVPHNATREAPHASTLEALRAAVVRSRKPADGGETHVSAWDDVPDVRDLDPDWGKKPDGDSDVHPKWRTQPCRNYLLGLCRYGSKCQFIHAPGLFAAASAHPSRAPLLPEYPSSLPHPVPHPVPLAVNATAPIPLPFPDSMLPVSVWGVHPGVGAAPEAAPGTKPEQMSLYYRTKLCKYFDMNGMCPHGAECKFIHNPNKAWPMSTRTPSLSPVSTSRSSPLVSRILPAPIQRDPSWADDDRELDFETTPFIDGCGDAQVRMDEDGEAGDAAMHDVTNSEDRRKSESARRRGRARKSRDAAAEKGGIYKPLWRVVGGGVGLGKSHDVNDREGPSCTRLADGDEDVVLEYQPRDGAGSFNPNVNGGSSAGAIDIHTPFPDDSPLEYGLQPFSFALPSDPTPYPCHALLRPPSPGAPLDITMGHLEWAADSGNQYATRKKRVVTGAELMRGLSVERTVSPAPHACDPPPRNPAAPARNAYKPKPRLTIAVPAFTHTHRRTQSYGVKGPAAARTPYPRSDVVAATTAAGDDVLDWGDSDSDSVEFGECAGGEDADSGVEGLMDGARRARSTPPTPRSSASYLDVPMIPPLAAESP